MESFFVGRGFCDSGVETILMLTFALANFPKDKSLGDRQARLYIIGAARYQALNKS